MLASAVRCRFPDSGMLHISGRSGESVSNSLLDPESIFLVRNRQKGHNAESLPGKSLGQENLPQRLTEPELLRYRSNLLGSDLRITNYGGGNTSAKVTQPDPLNGKPTEVLWVKGSGGDLGTISIHGFATLYLDKFCGLAGIYRGVEHEDDMVPFYPLCAFGQNTCRCIDRHSSARFPPCPACRSLAS